MATAYRATYGPRIEWFGTSGFPDREPSDARAYAKRLVTYIADASTVRAHTMNRFGRSPTKEQIRNWRALHVAETEAARTSRAPVVEITPGSEVDDLCATIAARLVHGGHLNGSDAADLEIDPDPVMEVVEALEPGEKPTRQRPLTTDEVIRDCAERVGSSPAEILGTSRKAVSVRARQFVVAVLRARGNSYPATGRFLGGRDHATMVHSVKAFFAVGMKDPLYVNAWMAAAPCATKFARSPAELDMLLGASR
ncbi:helix-turn-helix domain-containing protein [Novosphingobium sp.]|uniref:helix-turn-helix domain-containing protein n=1 Tax=Novosphingobium sp. TaxID=1874826 RepID=UPI0028AFFD51|nr:helix-turn-helix domain-containing protein [Novosphingobium sp.]